MSKEKNQLFFKIYGEGYPVIILHGLFGMSDNWQSFARSMAEEYMVILIDLRNHGRSFHSDSFSYDEMAQDLLHFMDKNWIHKSHIIGHSMGGKTAMKFAQLNPDMVNKMVVVDITPFQYQGGHEHIIKALDELELTRAKDRNALEENMMTKITDEKISRFLLKNIKRNKEGGFSWKMNFPILRDHYDRILEDLALQHIETPTLFVKGDQSNYILPENIDKLNEIFSNVKFETITDAGHWIHTDQPDTLLKVIIDFFKMEITQLNE